MEEYKDGLFVLMEDWIEIQDMRRKYQNMHKFKGKEMELQQNIVEEIDKLVNILKLSPIKKITQNKGLDRSRTLSRPDIIVFHEDESITIIEVKVNNLNRIYSLTEGIAQSLQYAYHLKKVKPNTTFRVYLAADYISNAINDMCQTFKLPIGTIEYNPEYLYLQEPCSQLKFDKIDKIKP